MALSRGFIVPIWIKINCPKKFDNSRLLVLACAFIEASRQLLSCITALSPWFSLFVVNCGLNLIRSS